MNRGAPDDLVISHFCDQSRATAERANASYTVDMLYEYHATYNRSARFAELEKRATAINAVAAEVGHSRYHIAHASSKAQ